MVKKAKTVDKKAVKAAQPTLLLKMPFSSAQKAFNLLYYGKGDAYADDFFTYATSDKQLAQCDANDFYFYLVSLAKKNQLPHKLRILEIGGGNGNNAAFFLDEFRKLDRKHRTHFYERTVYVMIDFSDTMLDSVKHNKNLRDHQPLLSLIQADASGPMGLKKSEYTYIRFNELYDDLPTELLMLEENNLYSVVLEIHLDSEVKIVDRKGKEVSHTYLAMLMHSCDQRLRELNPDFTGKLEFVVKHEPANMDVASFLLLTKELGEKARNLIIPFPYAAADNLVQLKQALQPNGRIDFFDYGFVSLIELKEIQSGIFRTPGALTTFVNIPFLAAIGKIAGFRKVLIEPQSDYFVRISKGEYTHDLGAQAKPKKSPNSHYHVHLS